MTTDTKLIEEFIERFADMLALVETHTGISERENVKAELLSAFAQIREGVAEEMEEELFTKIEYPNGIADGAWVYWGAIKNLLAQLKK